MESSTFNKSPWCSDPPMYCQSAGALQLVNYTDGGRFIESVAVILSRTRSARVFFQRTTLYDTLKISRACLAIPVIVQVLQDFVTEPFGRKAGVLQRLCANSKSQIKNVCSLAAACGWLLGKCRMLLNVEIKYRHKGKVVCEWKDWSHTCPVV